MSKNNLTFESKDAKNCRFVKVSGTIDTKNDVEFLRGLEEKLDPQMEKFVVDLSHAHLQGETAFVGVMLGRHKKCERIGCKMEVSNPSASVRKEMLDTGLSGIIPTKHYDWNTLKPAFPSRFKI